MRSVGRRIYYEKDTGNVIVRTAERQGLVKQTSVEQDIQYYKELSERNQETFDVIELEYGQYAQDFAECDGYRIDPETKALEFTYPDPNEPEVEQPYQMPLSEQVEELKHENQLLKAQNNALSERADFVEDLIAEMAIQVYQ